MHEHAEPATKSQHPTRFARVVVATDFSASAELAIGRAARLPLAEGGAVSLVHVLPELLPPFMHKPAEEHARRQLEQAAAQVSKVAEEAGRRDIMTSTELCRGTGYVEVLRHAKAIGADLIVLGRHGRRTVKDMFIGSTADRVIRSGELPVLVVRRKAKRAYRRPVIAVDMEGACRGVVATALRAVGDEVKAARLVHAYEMPFKGFLEPTALPGEMSKLRKEYKQTAATNLTKLVASLDDFGVLWKKSVVRGDPRAKVLDEAIRRGADLLAVGTHARTGLSHAVLGSVAEWLIHAAECDVLVAKPGYVARG